MVKKKLKNIVKAGSIVLGTLFLLSFASISVFGQQTTIDHFDRIYSENNRVNLFLYNQTININETRNPVLDFTLRIEEGFSECNACNSDIFGAFYLDSPNKSFYIKIAIADGSNTTLVYNLHQELHINNTYWYILTFYVDSGVNHFNVDFSDYLDNPLYPSNCTESLNDPMIVEYMLCQYFNDSCYLNGEILNETSYYDLFIEQNAFGIFYSLGDITELESISVKPDDGNTSVSSPDDYTLIITIASIGGISVIGVGLYRRKVYKSR